MKTLKVEFEIKPSERELLRELNNISGERYSRTGEPRDKTNSKVYRTIIAALQN